MTNPLASLANQIQSMYSESISDTEAIYASKRLVEFVRILNDINKEKKIVKC